MKSLLLQVGIDDSLIEAGPLTTEDWVLGANGRLISSEGHRVGDLHVCFLTPVSSTTILRTFYQFDLISYSEVHSLRLFWWLNQAVYWTVVYLSDGHPGHNTCINQRTFKWGSSGCTVFQENIIEMNNGCICCTVRGDLIAGLKKMATAPVKHSHNDVGQGYVLPLCGWEFQGLQKLGKKNHETVKQMISNLKIFIWNTLECDCPKTVCDLFGLRWRILSRTANHLMVLGLPLGRKDLCELGIFVGCKKSRFYRFSTCCGWDAYPFAGFWWLLTLVLRCRL